jgi:hypothetical protein
MKVIERGKFYYIVLMLSAFLLFGCSSEVEPDQIAIEIYNGEEQATIERVDSSTSEENTEEDDDILEGNNLKTREVDVNLTALNSIMLSGTMAHISNNQEEYVGRTTEVRGMYFAFYCIERNREVHVILIEDQAGCCQYGFEFEIKERFLHLSDFPPDGTMIEFRGIFQTNNELEQPIVYLLTEKIMRAE